MNVVEQDRYPFYTGPIEIPDEILDGIQFVECDVRYLENMTHMSVNIIFLKKLRSG